VVIFVSWPLYAQYPLDGRLGGTQSQFSVDVVVEEKRYLPLPGIEPQSSSSAPKM